MRTGLVLAAAGLLVAQVAGLAGECKDGGNKFQIGQDTGGGFICYDEATCKSAAVGGLGCYNSCTASDVGDGTNKHPGGCNGHHTSGCPSSNTFGVGVKKCALDGETATFFCCIGTTAAPTKAPTPSPTKAPTPSPTKAPVPVTAAPVPVTAAPVPVTAAPVPVTAAPVPVTAAPVPVTAAPVPVTAAPVPVTAAPVPVTAAPVPVTAAPVPVTAAPVPVTAAPVPVTAAPVPVTAAPVPVTNAPVPVTEAPVKGDTRPPVAPVQGDPAVFGMRGQFFHFEAADGWYSGVSEPHLQWNWQLTQFTGKVSKTKQDYITGEALTFFDDNGGVQQKLLMEFMDVSKPSQGCPGGLKTPCLHRGNLKVSIGDKIITEAGEYDLFEGAKLYAINAPLDCSHLEGKLHEFEEKRLADKRRKLGAADGFEIFTATTDVSGPDCSRWLALRRQQGTIYGAEYLTSIIITTPRHMVKFEFRENAKERWFWTDHSMFLNSKDADEIWSGVHGETKQAHYDSKGFEIMEGRKVIKGKDEDYLVDSPWGREFAARI